MLYVKKMKDKNNTWKEIFGITGRDASRLARELAERVYSPGLRGIDLLNRCREVMALGCEAYAQARRSVSLQKAIEVSQQERAGRRARTLYEISNVCRRLLSAFPDLADTPLRKISAEQCQEMLQAVFSTDLQYNKARVVLHAVFACGMRRGWCDSNPVDALPRPVLHESEVEPLPWSDLKNLLRMATREPHRCCMPAVGLMLWAGVRPAELLRLTWEDIDTQEKVITLRPRHSKTGGCRHITLHPVLLAWLRKGSGRLQDMSGRICPPNWLRRWKALRRAAGICRWQQDVLRHTFASYHLKHWHDLPRLQEEMGHRSARLLRTRYLSMKGITSRHAKQFWTPGHLG